MRPAPRKHRFPLTANLRFVGWCATVIVALLALAPTANAQVLFSDDFEDGLDDWVIKQELGAYVAPSGDPAHGNVLVLSPRGDVYALVAGSDEWDGVRMEGDVLFPDDRHNYLGFIYAFREEGERSDFGLIYIKGNGSYLRVNPHRDFNVGRTLYEEYRTPLVDDAAIVTGQWQRFKVEVIGSEAHVYVGDMENPQLTFPHLEFSGGAVGLHPRSVGGDVWVDNLTISSIDRFAHAGPPIPSHDYQPDSVVTAWEVAGPLSRTDDELGRNPSSHPDRWRPFSTDARGAVVTASVVDYHGPRSVGYFRTTVEADTGGEVVLHLSTVDDLAVWVNGRFHWFVRRQGLAWWDFWFNEEHRGQRIPIELQPGSNEIVIRVRGGVYATGGFFARVER